ncbi:MAG: PaaX family transcriptional regulator [Acidimicrobiales bacterium]
MVAQQPKSMVLNIYGAYGRRLGGWISVAGLVALLGDLGVDERAARSAVSRMKRRDLLVPERRHGRIGYALTDYAKEVLEEGDQRILARRPPAKLEDGWVVAVFSVPESKRGERHLLRSRLAWQGFGNVSPGVWIAPWRLAEGARRLVVRLGMDGYVDLFRADHEGFETTAARVTRWWNLDRLGVEYAQFAKEHSATAARWRRSGGDGRAAFVDYLGVVSAWQRFPYLDPGLPSELLPPAWEGQRAAEIFFDLVDLLSGLGEHYVSSVLSRYSP